MKRTLLFVALAASLRRTLYAHHSFTATYDTSRT